VTLLASVRDGLTELFTRDQTIPWTAAYGSGDAGNAIGDALQSALNTSTHAAPRISIGVHCGHHL
jgi:hypothetical protein